MVPKLIRNHETESDIGKGVDIKDAKGNTTLLNKTCLEIQILPKGSRHLNPLWRGL